MKRILALLLVFVLMPAACVREYPVRGPGGGLAMTVTLPEGFDPATDRCPMVILMHGIFSSKDFVPMPALSRSLARAGIASVRFDFNGHGRSEGRMRDMTVEREIADAMAVWDYVKALPYVERIGFLGHSQGGVIASMAAGRIAAGADGHRMRSFSSPPAPSSRRHAREGSSSTPASTPRTRRSTSAAGA